MVMTSAGMPRKVTSAPLKSPASAPIAMVKRAASQTLPLVLSIATKPTMANP